MTTMLVVLLILFTLLSGFFSGSETALFSLSSMRVRSYGRSELPGKQLIARLLSQPRDLLVTILMLNVLVNILVQNVAANLFAEYSGWGLKVGLPLILTLLFGEVIPKTVAYPNNQRIAGWVAPPIGFLHKFLGPIRRFITRTTGLLSKVMFFFLRTPKEISTEELQHALRTSEEHGVLTLEEADLVRGTIAFQEVVIKELMRPREELILYDINEPLDVLTELFVKKQISRVPVVDGDLESLLGIIDAQDYLVIRNRLHGPADLRKELDKPLFVPETMLASALLNKFDERDLAMAVVVDEYGTIAGLVTREDLVETVVGEIADVRDAKALYTRASADVIIASGKLELGELNDLFGCELSSEKGLVTIGGWLTEQIGELPQAGTKYLTEQFLFHVLAAEPNRVRRVYIRRLAGGKNG